MLRPPKVDALPASSAQARRTVLGLGLGVLLKPNRRRAPYGPFRSRFVQKSSEPNDG